MTISSRDFLYVFDRLIYHFDFPVAGPGSFPHYMVAQARKGHRKVVLSGQGGDEIFGGYAATCSPTSSNVLKAPSRACPTPRASSSPITRSSPT